MAGILPKQQSRTDAPFTRLPSEHTEIPQAELKGCPHSSWSLALIHTDRHPAAGTAVVMLPRTQRMAESVWE
jgi:hypothetical protein